MEEQKIVLQNVRVHNLKGVTLSLDKNQLIVFTGVSGSGKSSLAFDTLYMEGQRRYVESLSSFAKRQLGEMKKPDVEHTSGISPTISIEQKTAGRNPRSTVGTMTEIYDYLRVLYARVGVPHCPVSGEPVRPQSRERIMKTVQSLPEGTKIIVLSPYAKNKKGEFKEDFADLLKKGYMRVRIDGQIVDLDDTVALDRNLAHDVDVVIDRIVVHADSLSRIAEAVTQALQFSEGNCLIFYPEKEEEELFSMHAYSPQSGISYPSLSPQDFSFNSPAGMCPRCHGLGMIQDFSVDKVIDPNKSIAEDCCSVASSFQTVRYGNIYSNLANIFHFSLDTPWKKLSKEAQRIFLYGTEKKWTRMHFVHPVTGSEWNDYVQWRGVLYEAHQRYTEAKSDSYRRKIEELMDEQICPECHGERLQLYPAATLLGKKRISEVTQMTVRSCENFFATLTLDETETLIASELLKEIRERLTFLNQVGLHYLTLDRTAPTLSGGEAQRVRLASQIGCGLVGITYVLDEPSIGLHPRDNEKLIATLKHLRDLGNTIVVVEHDEETILAADYVVDFGPGAGARGGEIVIQGSVSALLNTPQSLTGAYLRGDKAIVLPEERQKKGKKALKILGAKHHNLKNIDVEIPLGLFLCVTGVSGSGKSSLITDILYPALANHLHHAKLPVGAHKKITGLQHIDKVIAIDQSPIGRNPRSNPSTYIKLFDAIRDLFSSLPESRARGYKPGRFSFNVSEGSCPQCRGMGMMKVDMDFMEDQWIECSMCLGYRFDAETLSVFYKGKNIYDILEMEVAEALEFFAHIPPIQKKLKTLHDVGMDYIKLGQSSTTLSGGEAQRVKLAKELVRPSTGNTLYILDEPTTGLHYHDIHFLLEVLHRLVDKGNTVLVIEHNMEVVKTADWIIDLGPEGGDEGGEIIATGTPEKIARQKTPTGRAVDEILHPDFAARRKYAEKKKETLAAERKEREQTLIRTISVEDAEQNNLKNIHVDIPRDTITLFTGPSGSGKTSLAFETIYAEGQRRYIESLSPYARQFVKQMPKPKVGYVGGLSPAIAIEQKAHAGNPRSTVGTMTEVYDYLRILYARIGIPHCPETGEVIQAMSKQTVIENVLSFAEGTKVQILASITLKKEHRWEDLISRFRRQGFIRILLNGTTYDLDQEEKEVLAAHDRKRKNEIYLIVDRLLVNPTIHNRLAEAIETAAKIGKQKLVVLKGKEKMFYNLSFSVASTGKSYPEITPQTFAFNTQGGMCIDCQGLGYQYGANLTQHKDLMHTSLLSILRTLWKERTAKKAFQWVHLFLEEEGIDPYAPLDKLTAKQKNTIMNGSPEEKSYATPSGLRFRWLGLNTVFARLGKSARNLYRTAIIPLLDEYECPSCSGARINPLARHVTIDERPIHAVCALPIHEAYAFIQSIQLTPAQEKILSEVLRQLLHRLQFLQEVGLHYIALERRAPTLSGGEAQRIRLARQLGTGLTGLLYVLDEPTIGLHPRDNDRLNRALTKLKGLGNTLLLVEHDPLTIEHGDYLLDFGPHAGVQGGYIVAKGTLDEIKKNPDSLTGAYLTGRREIPVPKKRRPRNKGKLTIHNAHLHNLKDLSLAFPIATLSCLTGVSGSGKSTLLQQILFPALEKGLPKKKKITIEGTQIAGLNHFDKMLSITQNPIGLTARSDVGTYVDLLPRMRDFFASLPKAKIRGLTPGHFSYNQRRGMCTHCWGMGYRKIEMHFLPPVRVVCEQCHGLRLNPISLEVVYKEKNFGEYLDTTVDEAYCTFETHPRIKRILDTLRAVGLGYVKIGQEMASLSGGEAQRIKLSRELAKRSTGKTVYLLDEPTTGLHSDDIEKLLRVLHKLIDKGNTVIMIEHNLDMIKNADYVIDLGPEAGEAGGEIVAEGTPEEIASNEASWTGQYLRPLLSL